MFEIGDRVIVESTIEGKPNRNFTGTIIEKAERPIVVNLCKGNVSDCFEIDQECYRIMKDNGEGEEIVRFDYIRRI